MIFDEVISGFRVGVRRHGASGSASTPDLVTYGKVIGGGFPVGAYGGRRELMDLVAPAGPVYQAGTLSANPVAMAAGLATLRKLESHPPYAALEKRTRELASRTRATGAAKRGDEPLRVQTDGSLFWIVLGDARPGRMTSRGRQQIPATHRERFPRLFHALLDRGVYLAPSGFEVGFLSTAHTDADLEQFLTAFDAALADGAESMNRATHTSQPRSADCAGWRSIADALGAAAARSHGLVGLGRSPAVTEDRRAATHRRFERARWPTAGWQAHAAHAGVGRRHAAGAAHGSVDRAGLALSARPAPHEFAPRLLRVGHA